MIKFESGHIISHMAILSYNLQTSVYLPVCDFLIVDSAQQYRVKQFNLIYLSIFRYVLTLEGDVRRVFRNTKC